jgi:hypothetical protein
MRRIPVALSLSGVASAGDFLGQASVIDGDILEIHGRRGSAFGGSMHRKDSQLCRGEDSSRYRCCALAANDLDAFIARSAVFR